MLKRLSLHQCIATFGILLSTLALPGQTSYPTPAGYYSGVDNRDLDNLRAALNNVTEWDSRLGPIGYDPSNNTAGYMRAIDEDENNTANMLMLYTDQTLPKGSFGTSGGTVWNREHTWPQSYGTDTEPARSDLHALFPAHANVNSQRSNYAFSYVPVGGSSLAQAPQSFASESQRRFEPWDADKGRIARALFYMDIRYEGQNSVGDLNLADRPNSGTRTMGLLSDLLAWNRMFAVDEWERKRNHFIYWGVSFGGRSFRQGNRNPFIDFPDLADAIYLTGNQMTRGKWRVMHFTLAELLDDSLSGPLADPEGDGLPNLLELAFNLDPFADDSLSASLPKLSVDETGAYSYSFTRLAAANLSGLVYTVEYSEDPTNPASWQSVASNRTNPSSAPNATTHTITLGENDFGSFTYTPAFRITIARTYPLTEEAPEATYDPVLLSLGDQAPTLFSYEQAFPNGYRQSPWFGWVYDAFAPYYYHLNHGWVYSLANSQDGLWFYDPTLGWTWTSRNLYPNLYRNSDDSWYFFFPSSFAPERRFYSYTTEQEVLENDL
jgi:endonuclease I